MKKILLIFICISSLFFYSCEKDKENIESTPIAEAGEDLTINLGETATLDGSNSTDPNGDELSFTWTILNKPENSQTSITNANQAIAEITPDTDGAYQIEILVSDGKSEPATDRLTITGISNTPVANAGENQNIEVGATVVLDGSGSIDPDGEELSFKWEFISKPAESTAEFTSPNLENTEFTADVNGEYEIQLTVEDGFSDPSTDKVLINATLPGAPPIPNAGEDNEVYTDYELTLNAGNTSDPDGDELEYQWSILEEPDGSTTSINNPDSRLATFTPDEAGLYKILLGVTDNIWPVQYDTLEISATVEELLYVEGAGVIDIDGNEYKTVIINEQEWMAENLSTSKYRNGDPIPNLTDNTEWVETTVGAWAYYDNDQANEEIHGKLYNARVIFDEREVCPEGWRVPTEEDYMSLIDFLGGIDIAGLKMKSKEGWNDFIAIPGNNKSGLNVPPSGWRIYDGTFGYQGTYVTLLTSTIYTYDQDKLVDVGLNFDSDRVNIGTSTKINGNCIRCIKDSL